MVWQWDDDFQDVNFLNAHPESHHAYLNVPKAGAQSAEGRSLQGIKIP